MSGYGGANAAEDASGGMVERRRGREREMVGVRGQAAGRLGSGAGERLRPCQGWRWRPPRSSEPVAVPVDAFCWPLTRRGSTPRGFSPMSESASDSPLRSAHVPPQAGSGAVAELERTVGRRLSRVSDTAGPVTPGGRARPYLRAAVPPASRPRRTPCNVSGGRLVYASESRSRTSIVPPAL